MHDSLLRRKRRGGFIGALIGGSAGAAAGAGIGTPLVDNAVDGLLPLAFIGLYFVLMIGILVAGLSSPERSDS